MKTRRIHQSLMRSVGARFRTLRRDDRATTLTEFVIALPVLLMLFMTLWAYFQPEDVDDVVVAPTAELFHARTATLHITSSFAQNTCLLCVAQATPS